jgi:hypothetical protein
MSKRPSWTTAVRDYSVPLGDWIWVATDGTMPPQAALQWAELVETAPGIKEWKSLQRGE